ncbi:MAG: hypothetical protein M3Z23_08000, partial [Acidobacteriota bacterium]|nr:hypothetical protein [Acidobacteriota bacterium]
KWVERSLAIPNSLPTTTTFTAHGLWFLRQIPGNWDILPVDGPDGILGSLFWATGISPMPPVYQYQANSLLSDKITFEVCKLT